MHCLQIVNRQIHERRVSFTNNQFQWQVQKNEKFTQLCQHLPVLHSLADDYQTEVNLQIPGFIGQLAENLQAGMILLADYGYGESEYYHRERTSGTLSCFYQHQLTSDPFQRIGYQDITAHVNFTEVARASVNNNLDLIGYTTQNIFLLNCGLIDLMHEFETTHDEIANHQLHQAIKLLTLPQEMGERIKVMALAKNVEPPTLGFQMGDRIRDL